MSPTAPVRHHRLEVPEWLEVISVDVATAMSDTDKFARHSRWLYTVFGRHRETNKHFLLVYEGSSVRSGPIEIVAVEHATMLGSAGTARP
jgi:hypothetical protein